jgi:HEAT repeat protein
MFRHVRLQRVRASKNCLRTSIGVAAAIVWLGIGSTALAKQGGPRALDLEGAVTQADLVIAVRVTDVSQREMIHGGKMARSSQQFTFQPVRRLKGVFARPTLHLTSDDLGTDQFDEREGQIERGQMRLLILGRSARGFDNSNRAAHLDLSIPPLTGEADPLLSAVEVLIAIGPERDRSKRVVALVKGLKQAPGKASIPLLRAVQRRSLLAAQTDGVVASIAGLLGDPSTEVREIASEVLGGVLDADYLDQRAIHTKAMNALVEALGKAGPDLSLNVALTEALGAVGSLVNENAQARARLRLGVPLSSFAEQIVRARALRRIRATNEGGTLIDQLTRLPLDAPAPLQQALDESIAHLAADRAAEVLSARLRTKHAAGLNVSEELRALGELAADRAIPALLEAAKLPLEHDDRVALANVGSHLPDSRMVPLLSGMLDPRRADLRSEAVAALLKIETNESAQALKPHLAEEGQLFRKLQIAAFLGRFGIRDGYPYAIEHMSEPGLLEEAVTALAAIKEPKAIDELSEILKSSHDAAWNQAAIRALGRLGRKEYATQFLELARDLRSPLAPAAQIALADLGELRTMPIIREAFSSRNDDVVVAATRAAATLLKPNNVPADDLRDRLAALLSDADASQATRFAALDALTSLGDARLEKSLTAAVLDVRLEGSDLLARIERIATERKLVLRAP